MGRLKKKLVEYVESTENEEHQNRNRLNEKALQQLISPERIEREVTTFDFEIEGSEKLRTAERSRSDDDNDVQNENSNCQAPQQDIPSDEYAGVKKGASKRKIIQGHNKKNQKMKVESSKDSKDEIHDGEIAIISDDILSNDHGEDTLKRGRKTVTKKTKGKAKSGGKNRGQSSKNDNSFEEETEQSEEYEVEDVVDHKIERGVNFYLIRWKGYAKTDDTWEAEDTLTCPDMVEEYKRKMLGYVTKVSKGKNTSVNKKGRKPNATKTISKDDPNKEWEVEKIIDYAIEKTGRIFRIRWRGFGPKNDTWEPEKNLYCDDLIEKFMKRMESQKNITFKELRETPKKTKRLLNETAPRTTYHNPGERKSKRAGSKKRVYYGDSDD